MEEKLNIIPSQDPRGMYLHGIAQAIANLTEKETDAYWFNNDTRTQIRKNWIDDLHKKAMEVIATIPQK